MVCVLKDSHNVSEFLLCNKRIKCNTILFNVSTIEHIPSTRIMWLILSVKKILWLG